MGRRPEVTVFIRLTKNQDSSGVKSTQSPQTELRTIITFTRKRDKRKRKNIIPNVRKHEGKKAQIALALI